MNFAYEPLNPYLRHQQKLRYFWGGWTLTPASFLCVTFLMNKKSYWMITKHWKQGQITKGLEEAEKLAMRRASLSSVHCESGTFFLIGDDAKKSRLKFIEMRDLCETSKRRFSLDGFLHPFRLYGEFLPIKN